MTIPFFKANACGNDFLLIDGSLAPHDPAAFTRRICDRRFGVGADGVEWLYPAKGVDIEARLINADGSFAEISGNGTRCVAAYLCFQQAASLTDGEKPADRFVIRTGAGDKECRFISREGNSYGFEADMGVPEVGSERAIHTSRGAYRGTPVSLGNPHFVIFVDAFPDEWQLRAAEIQRDSSFPEGVNVEFVIVHDRERVEARFFERGAGETLSSGTGSSASAAAAIASKRAHAPLRVDGPGGAQYVRWEEQLHLRGSAELICQGEFFE
jgi:diaminopimelate epimerase